MPDRKLFTALALASFALAGCAARPAPVAITAAPREKPDWAFQASDVPVDPAWRFGKLANGMRYALRRNGLPQGTGLIRLMIDSGSLDEADSERGFAHFVEHMAFNGSTHVPEGEMVRLLERNGLAFGAHTNAQTSFDYTLYQLDLPTNRPELLDTALMLMRETASELSFSEDAVARERGVVLSEMRDRNTFALRNLIEQLDFAVPGARFAARIPIGTTETLNAATGTSLRTFWQRSYVPAKARLVVIGDFDPDQIEAAIRARFDSWSPAPSLPQPDAGPVNPADRARTDIFLDPALAERITATRNAAWLDEPDSLAQRRENLLRQIGYAIVNRRLIRLSRQANPPFRSAGLSTNDVFHTARSTSLAVDTVDGKWRRGLTTAAIEYRRAMSAGFTPAEIAEQIANTRLAARNEATGADTRTNAALFGAVFALLHDDVVPSTPQGSLERLEAFIPEITPDRVLAALQREAVRLDDPLLRFQGRRDPEGGEHAIRIAWDQAMHAALGETAALDSGRFGYTDFGPPGAIASDSREPSLGIREVRFANGVRLNLKRTSLETGKVLVQVSLDGGEMLDTRDHPLATAMAQVMTAGGLGKHSQDDLQSLLAGRTASPAFTPTPESFVAAAQTTPDDLELQLQLFAATITDPGYRAEGEVLFRQTINNYFASMKATPGSALNAELGGILSDNDPRFTLQDVEAYRRLTFAQLRDALADRLAHGAIEIGLVGDLDEDRAIGLVSRTLGALPAREPVFRPYADRRTHPFTADNSERTILHNGASDQAIVQLTWPTRDGEDPVAEQEFALLQRVVQLAVTDSLRERLGKAYSPGVSSETSRVWRDYGTFAIAASVAVSEVGATRTAIDETVAALRDAPISADMLLRAREPMLDGIDNALKSNRGWLALVDRAQTEPDRIERYLGAKARLSAITPARIQELVRRYLTTDRAVPVQVLPQPAASPAP